MKHSRWTLVACCLGLLLSTGCAIGHQKSGRVIDHRLITQVKVGTSTKQDVLDLFGPPSSYSRVGADGSLLGRPSNAPGPTSAPTAPTGGKEAEDVFLYEYVEDDELFFTLLLFTYFRRENTSDRLMVFFDRDDVVKYMAFAKQTEADPADEDDQEESESE